MIAAIVKLLTGGLVDKIVGLADSYFKKQITEAEFRAEVEKIRLATEAQMTAQVTESVQATVRSSPAIQRAYAAVLFLQVAVLVWFQIGVGAFELITGVQWPDPGVTLEWAYLLVGVMVGAGPLVFRR